MFQVPGWGCPTSNLKEFLWHNRGLFLLAGYWKQSLHLGCLYYLGDSCLVNVHSGELLHRWWFRSHFLFSPRTLWKFAPIWRFAYFLGNGLKLNHQPVIFLILLWGAVETRHYAGWQHFVIKIKCIDKLCIYIYLYVYKCMLVLAGCAVSNSHIATKRWL